MAITNIQKLILILSAYKITFSASLFSLNNVKGFQNCNFLTFEFDVVSEGQIEVPAVRYRIDSNLSGVVNTKFANKAGNDLEVKWKRQRPPNCQWISVVYPPSNLNFAYIPTSFLWLMACSPGARCYVKNLYYIVIRADRSNIIPWQEAALYFVPKYELTLIKSYPATISLELGMPCKAKITSTIEQGKNILKISRATLDTFYGDMLASCPLKWDIDTGQSFIMWRNRSDLLFQPGPTYLVYEAVKVLNNLPTVSIHNYTAAASLCHPFYAPCSISVTPSFLKTDLALASSYKFFTSEMSYNFLTCDGAKTFISFMAFVSPFKLSVWYATLAVIIFLWLYLTAQAIYFKPATHSPVFLILQILLKQNIRFVTGLKEMGSKR